MDLAKLSQIADKAEEGETSSNANLVAGRVLQYDADFACYQCSNLEESIEENFDVLKKYVQVKRNMAKAEHINCHITLGMKSGREFVATVKPYQEKRDNHRDPKLKARVHDLRVLLANYKTDKVTPVVDLSQEADDTMTQYHTSRLISDGLESSVIMSGDKDLWMNTGWHCDQFSARMWLVTGFGKTEYRDVGNVKPKLVGEGTSWFWYQMLMGDTADNIPGLEKIGAKTANRFFPTKTFNPARKPLACGEAKAVGILRNVTNDKEAFTRVYAAYQNYYGAQATDRFIEQGILLWMRHYNKMTDFLDWLSNEGLAQWVTPTWILEADKKWKEKIKLQEEIRDAGK